jgi:hypothetical protein
MLAARRSIDVSPSTLLFCIFMKRLDQSPVLLELILPNATTSHHIHPAEYRFGGTSLISMLHCFCLGHHGAAEFYSIPIIVYWSNNPILRVDLAYKGFLYLPTLWGRVDCVFCKLHVTSADGVGSMLTARS